MTASQADTLMCCLDAYLAARAGPARRPPYPGLESARPIEAGWAAREVARTRVELTLALMRTVPGPGEGPAGAWEGDERRPV
jgi:hypothetical protein